MSVLAGLLSYSYVFRKIAAMQEIFWEMVYGMTQAFHNGLNSL